MNMTSLVIILFLVCFSQSQTFNLVKHQILAENTGPRCLDGSPAAMYIDIGQLTDRFLIFFEGGGLCRGDGMDGMLNYCLQRSTTDLGSSRNYPDKKSLSEYVFLNPDPQVNPNFHKWTRVFVPYCDGSLHQGFKSSPVQYKGKKLYFRGQNNTAAHFGYLNKNFNLFNASQIVISGTSAGAVATYMWGNYVYNKAVNKPSVFLLPDSGIFLSDFVNPWTNKTMAYYTSSLLQLVFQETKLPTSQCLEKYNNLTQCFKVGNLHDILLPKTLVIQSTYDAWGLEQILGLRCLTYPVPSSIQKCTDEQRAYIEQYHQGLQESISNFTKEQRHGIWSIACVQHGFVDRQSSYQNTTYESPYPKGQTLQQAVTKFMSGHKVSQIDDLRWPNNQGCNGMAKTNFLRRSKNIQIQFQ